MAEYTSTVQLAGAAAKAGPQQAAYRLFRSSDGKTRVDTGSTSVISDPTAGKTIVLDHMKKTALITPSVPQAPPIPGMPQMPGMPGMSAMPQAPTVQVQDLGKTIMQGQEVEGKRYTIQPPAMPQVPGLGGVPPQMGKPQIPGVAAPQVPGPGGAPPQMRPKPQIPTVAEVWTSPKLQLPMASKISGSFGQQTAVCQKAVPGEPNPAIFQAPPDYKQILPTPPKLPAVPKPPAIPGVAPPKLPGM